MGDRFEVASIKPSGPQSVRGSDGGPGHKDAGHFVYGKAELMSMILMAWNVRQFQVSGKIPLDLDEFDLTAVVPAGATKAAIQSASQRCQPDYRVSNRRCRPRAHPSLFACAPNSSPCRH